MAKCNKSGQVIQKLDQLGLKVVLRSGWFQSFPQLMVHKIRSHPLLENYKPLCTENMILQSGISRSNCADCLDRTNVAQYGISENKVFFVELELVLGKVALGFQLHAMGYVSDPLIPANGELCRAFEEMWDEHGDIGELCDEYILITYSFSCLAVCWFTTSPYDQDLQEDLRLAGMNSTIALFIPTLLFRTVEGMFSRRSADTIATLSMITTNRMR